jgi:hypothetical protein
VFLKILPERKPPALLRPHTVNRTPPCGTVKKHTGKPGFKGLFLEDKPVAYPVAVVLETINDIDPQDLGNLDEFLLIDPDVARLAATTAANTFGTDIRVKAEIKPGPGNGGHHIRMVPWLIPFQEPDIP